MSAAAAVARLIRRRRIKGVFLTGTDTHIGKTHFTLALARELADRGLRVAALKPVACGRCGRDDAIQYWRLAGKSLPLHEINPYWFKKPLAPVGQRRNPRISLFKIRRGLSRARKSHDTVLLEGAGGLLTPLTWKISVSDLVAGLRLPLIVVARAGLGTLNHTMLTLQAARSAGLKALAVVLNDLDGRNARAAIGNRRVLRRLLRVPVLIQGFEPIRKPK